MQLPPATFERLQRQVQRLCGLALGADKEYLVRDRLEPLLRRHSWKSFEELAERLEQSRDTALADGVVEAIVTHETSFFRDPHVWEAVQRRVLPEILARRGKVRIWSAATSTGQEAYSLAMLCSEFDARGPDRCSILATDICESALRAGAAGEYDVRELDRGVSAARRQRFFHPAGRKWRVNEGLRRMIEFRRVNLAAPLPALGTFDLICCRNLLIYFSLETRQQLCERLRAALADGGWLLLGAAENLYGVSDRFSSFAIDGALIYRQA